MHVPDNLTEQWNDYQNTSRTPFDQLNPGDLITIYVLRGKRVFLGVTSIRDKINKISECYIYCCSGKYRKNYDYPFKIVVDKESTY